LIFTNAKNNTVVKNITFEELQKVYPTLKRFPSLLEVSVSNLTFSGKKNDELYC